MDKFEDFTLKFNKITLNFVFFSNQNVNLLFDYSISNLLKSSVIKVVNSIPASSKRLKYERVIDTVKIINVFCVVYLKSNQINIVLTYCNHVGATNNSF